MTISFNYDQNFTSNYVDKQLEESPFIDVIGAKFKGTIFLKTLFRNYPSLFNNNASNLFYVEHAGRTVKPNFLYLAFENFMTNSNDNIIKAKLNNIPLYTINQDPIIQWARYLQHTCIFPKFEPVLGLNSNALKSFIGNDKEFVYKNLQLSISKIKPLCVNNVGENVAELMMYIAYLYNFFINCKPYIFNEVVAGSSVQLFGEAINNHINTYFTKLITEGTYINPKSKVVSNTFKFRSLDEFYADINNIQLFNPEEVKSIISQILNQDQLLKIRNKIISNDKNLSYMAESSQNTLTQDFVYKGYLSVMNNLVDIVVKYNYFNISIFQKFPRFNENNVNYHELFLLTEYAMSGGFYPFIINDNEQYEVAGDPNGVILYPLIKEQRYITGINNVNIAEKKPFCSANIFLDIVTGYTYQKFEEYQNQVFEHPPILMEEKDIDHNGDEYMDETINKLYLNGKYNLYSDQLSKAFKFFVNKDEFMVEYGSILNLANLFTILYDNKFGAKFLPAYILSYLPEYLLKYMENNVTNQTLDLFNFMMFFVLHHKEANLQRIQKLANMEMSILYINNPTFVKFVNNSINTISNIINMNSYIIQPYMVGTSAKIGPLPMGGISLGFKFIDTNPLSRGYYFVVNTQGNSEKMHSFYKFIKNINDSTLLELIQKAITDKNDGYLKELINTAFDKLLISNKIPNTLYKYIIDEKTGSYTVQTNNYFIDMVTSNGIPIYKLFANYSFNPILAKNTQIPSFVSRQIYKNKTISKAINGAIQFDNNKYPCTSNNRGEEYELPTYDFSSLIKQVELTFVQPNGYKLLKIYTMNGELLRNNLFWVFTQANTLKDNYTPIFNVYDTIYDGVSTGVTKEGLGATIFTTNLSSQESSAKRLAKVPNAANHTFSANRMKLNGIDKMPITNVKNTF